MRLSQILKDELHVSHFSSPQPDNLTIDSDFEYFSLMLHAYLLHQGFLCTGFLNLAPTDSFILDLSKHEQKWKAPGMDLIVFLYENAQLRLEKKKEGVKVEVKMDDREQEVVLELPDQFEDVDGVMERYAERVDSLLGLGPKHIKPENKLEQPLPDFN